MGHLGEKEEDHQKYLIFDSQTLRKLRQEDYCQLEAAQSYRARVYLKTQLAN